MNGGAWNGVSGVSDPIFHRTVEDRGQRFILRNMGEIWVPNSSLAISWFLLDVTVAQSRAVRPSTITSTATTNRDTVMRRTVRIDIGEPHTKGGIVRPAASKWCCWVLWGGWRLKANFLVLESRWESCPGAHWVWQKDRQRRPYRACRERKRNGTAWRHILRILCHVHECGMGL